MTKPQHAPWRDADPLFSQTEIDLATEWITLLAELMCNPCVANTVAGNSAPGPGSIGYRCGRTTGGSGPLAPSVMSACAVCEATYFAGLRKAGMPEE
jgi:hypothetical protein